MSHHPSVQHVLDLFELPHLSAGSALDAKFRDLAEAVASIEAGQETTIALRALLTAYEAAVRAEVCA